MRAVEGCVISVATRLYAKRIPRPNPYWLVTMATRVGEAANTACATPVVRSSCSGRPELPSVPGAKMGPFTFIAGLVTPSLPCTLVPVIASRPWLRSSCTASSIKASPRNTASRTSSVRSLSSFKAPPVIQ